MGAYPDGRPFYAMRFIKGDSLKDAIANFHQGDGSRRDPGERALALRQLLGRFVAVCQAVAYAHSRGVLHRDLKPANVMLGKYGETLVVDWGLAKAVGRPEGHDGTEEVTLNPTLASESAPTQMGQALGTPAYMSPEQAAGRLDLLGPASDVYSLGATLYHLLTGKAPFAGGDAGEILRQVQRGDFPAPRQVKRSVPAALEGVCLKAMALKPEDRYASAQELAADVERWLADEPVTAYREPLWTRLGRWRRRHRPLVAVATVVLLVAMAGGVGLAWQRAALARAVDTDLDEVARWQQDGRWAEARASMERAEGRLAGAGPETLRRRLDQARADLDVVAHIEEARLGGAIGNDPLFNRAAADYALETAFAGYGLPVLELEPVAAAERVAASPVRDQLVAGLDAWAERKRNREDVSWKRLLEVARQADPDPWRNRLREMLLKGAGRQELVALANSPAAREQTPATVVLLAKVLDGKGAREEAVELLRPVQQRHPDDFWVSYQLAFYLFRGKEPASQREEAIGYYRAALAARPLSADIHALFGNALSAQGRHKEAEAAYRRAVELNPDLPKLICQDGRALVRKGRLQDAEFLYRYGLKLKPDYFDAHNDLGNILKEQGRLQEAEATYRRAMELKPDDAVVHLNLGFLLVKQGRFAEALTSFTRCHELGTKQPHWSYPSAELVKQAQRLVALETKLPAVLKGEAQPADAAECLALASLCQKYKRLYAAAARFFSRAFADQPRFADDLQRQTRYNAACAAALAGCGQGEDAATLDDKERARWRKQARDWLQADLATYTKQLDGGKPQDRDLVRQRLTHWQTDADLAGLRDPAAVAKLPADEQAARKQLWSDVAALLQKATVSNEPAK